MTSPTPDHWQVQDARLARPTVDLTWILLGGPKLDENAAGALAEVEAERKGDFGRATDLGAG